MKHGIKKRILSLVLCISMVLPMAAVPMPVYSVESEESIVPLTNPFTPETTITLPDGTTTSSQSYRIPSMVTLADGTIVAAADIRWNTTFDGGGLDTLVARSTDGGANWSYTVANYLGDNGNVYNGGMSTTFIDPNLLVAADGQTVYMLVDLYAYGVALNGDGSHIQPVADTGFDANGNLKLSNNNHSSYDYYLKDGKIYNSSNQVEEGYTVDPYFNITYTLAGENKESNLFFADSPFKVARTQYLYLTKSTDGGATWSEPNLLDVRAKAKVAATENALLVSPGNSITTSDGIMVYPAYSFIDSDHQSLALIYSVDGVNWERSTDYTALNWSSEGAIVELENGNIRVFVRNKTKHLCYVDFDVRTMTWIGHTDTGVPTNSNTQLSAITYSKTSNGDQVVLISCPTGPNGAGSDNNDGSMRTNGKIHVFTVNATGEMTLQNTVNVFENLATGALSDNYTETKGFFAYSSLTERADGSVALLYENNQFGWGASGSNGNGTYNPENVDTYYTITARTYDWFELLYGNVSEELKVAYEKLMDTDLIADFEAEYETLSASDIAELQESVMWDDIAVHKCLLVYDHFYSTVSELEFNAVKEKYPQEYAYIQNEPELKYFNDQILERVKYLDQHPEDRYVQFGDVEYVELPSYTNVAPLVKPVVNTRLRSRATTGTFALTKNAVTAANDADNGVVLDKNVIKNADGTYTVRLEAYTTGQTVTVVTEREKPVDIVLVLDLSSSMVSGRMDAVGYQVIQSAVAEQGYQLGADENLFVKIGDEYREVSVTGTDPTTTKPQQYTGDRTAEGLHDYLRNNALYYEVGGEYKRVYPKRTGKGTRKDPYKYNFYYQENGQEKYIVSTAVSGDASIDAFTFYTDDEDITVYEKYIYSYVDENNQTVNKTYNPTDSIVGDDNPVYYTTYASGTISRAEALINALNSFTSQVAKKAAGKDGDITTTEDNVNHTIAIVGYNTAGSSTTGIYMGSTVNVWSNTNSITQAQYAAALQAMNTQAGVDNIEASIEKLKTSNASGTNTFAGVSMAHSILQANPQKDDPDRNQVVVIFTDGQPYGSQTINGTSYTPENAAIYHAKQIKDMGATVYTVGILDDGNATIPPSGKINIFMHGMSSNYKNATSTSNLGELTNDRYNVDGSNYYLLASNADDLNNIFTSISSSATSGGSITNLSTETQIRDIISPYFQLPEGTVVSDIKLYYADYEGENKWSGDKALTGATPTIIDEKTIGVTGFDYKENWVGTATEGNTVTYHGKKLIIEFPIVVDPDFLGGSNVVTNGDTSGIYASADAKDPIEKFDVPDVDVALANISTVVQDKHIYLGNTVDLTDLLNLYVTRTGQTTPLQVTVDGINNAYVNLEYTITLDNNTVAVYTIPAGKTWSEGTWTTENSQLLQNYLATKDTTLFSVTCVMTDAAANSDLDPNFSTANGTATVYVYKPTITFKDTTKTPMEDSLKNADGSYKYDAENYVSVVWKHGDTEASSNVEGTAPTLTYTYSTPNGCLDGNGLVITYNEFYVNVAKVESTGKTGKGNNQTDIVTDITNYVTFEHSSCPNTSGCSFNKNLGEFIIHLTQVYTSLTIKKVGADAIDPNQSFLFDVVEVDAQGNPIDTTKTVTVTVHENGSVTIEGLLVNHRYKVTEDTDWSWRYLFSNWAFESGGATVSSGTTNDAVVTLGSSGNIITFTNSRSIIWWLDGDSWCNNIFK